ncbi:Flagellar hook-associated protein FliD [hydrothermal vent metagenome]|uniref:Filament cap protein n=1 Tax=hydrothermal vent metagenome TaxID=652676 RepID=A0A3B0WV80_9ZZZZ
MPSITAPGIGSGLDVQAIVSQLMAIERQPLERLQFRQNQLETQISAYGQLSSTLSTFQTAMNDLGSFDALKVFTTNTSNPDVIDLTATSSADLGTFNVEVIRLAEPHKMSSNEVLNTDTFGGTAGDSLTIQVGALATDTITIDLSTSMTLRDIRDAINDDAAANPGVQATVINGDNGNQKLIFTADNSGADNALTLSYGGAITATTLNMQTLNNIAGDTSLLDSEFIVDGFNITRSSNNVGDVISGVTLNFVSADPGSTYTVGIERDLESVETSVQAFADAFNALRSSIKDLRLGQLEADSSLLSIERRVFAVLNAPATDGTFSVLSDIGLSMQKDGTMSLANTDLQAALQTDFDGVAQLFASDTQGFAKRLADLADSLLASDGLIETRTDGLESRVDVLVDRQDAFTRSLEQVEARFRAQFSALDALVGQLQGTGQFLTAQLAQLPGAGR